MDAPAPRVREGSLLHRLTGITPGYAPAWLCSRNGCDAFDLFAVLLTVAIVAVGLIFALYREWVCAALPFFAIGALPIERFAYRERFGRARLYRGECVWCGRPATPPGSDCPACHRLT